MEGQIIEDVLHKFTDITGIKANWAALKRDSIYDRVDGTVIIHVGNQKEELPAEVQKTIVNSNIPSFINTLRVNGKMVVLAETIAPKIRQALKQHNINYMDAAGNAYIIHKNIYIYLEGQKPIPVDTANKAKAFGKTGLKVIYQFLEHPDLINTTIRDIADHADVSLDTAHKTINVLKEAGYLIKVDSKTLLWDNFKELLQKWMEEFETRLKPGLHIGNFKFLKEDDFYNWKNIQFKNGNTIWGGEPAGELLTGFLKPQTLTLYTNEFKSDLMKNYKIIPDEKGYIQVYQKFWKQIEENKKTAPPVLVYADLVNTGNNRNIETAQKIYEQQLQNKF